MEDLLTTLLGNTHGLVAYLAVFGVLIACGLGVPLPEDISLILGGYLAHTGAASLPVMMLVGFGGILVGDSLIFFAGRRIGSRVGTNGGFFARIVTPEKRAKVEGLFKIHGEKIVMIARFLPGVRAVTYFTAGSAGMKFSHFILFDGLAALLSAPVFVWLGFHFGGELEQLTEKLKDGQVAVVVALVLAGVGYFLYRRRMQQRARLAAAQLAINAIPVPASVDERIVVPSQPSASADRFVDSRPRSPAGLGKTGG